MPAECITQCRDEGGGGYPYHYCGYANGGATSVEGLADDPQHVLHCKYRAPHLCACALHPVSLGFTLAGDLSDYDTDAAKAAIKATLATGAGVTSSEVSLTMTPGSVNVVAEIAVPDASTTTAALSGGIMASASALQAALNTEFAFIGLATDGLTVEYASSPTTGAATQISFPAAPSSSAGAAAAGPSTTSNLEGDSSGGGGSGAAIGGAAGGVVVLLLVGGGAYYYHKKKKATREPQSVPAKAAGVTLSVVEAKSASADATADAI
jgi:hypothetical protein